MGNARSREPLVKEEQRNVAEAAAIAVPGKRTGALHRVFSWRQGQKPGFGSPIRTLDFPCSRSSSSSSSNLHLCSPSLDAQSQFDVLEGCRAALEKRRDYLAQDTPDLLKQFLECPLPPMAEEVKSAYYLHSPPPLEDLCPFDFPTLDWASFDQQVAAWFATLADDAVSPSSWFYFDDFRHQMLELVNMLGPETPDCFSSRRYNRFLGEPDGALQVDYKCKLVMVMGVVELEKLDLLVARLYTYMLTSGALCGIASSFENTVFCKMLPDRQGLLVSKHVSYKDGVLKRIAFMIRETIRGEVGTVHDLDIIPRPVPAKFDWEPIHARMVKLGARVDVESLITGCNNDFQLVQELDDLRSFQTHRYGSANVCYTAKHRGRAVFLKVMDLSCHYYRNLDESLVKGMREVQAYNRMKQLQGRIIPELLGYGFFRGATFFYLMMSYAHTGSDLVPDLPMRARALPRSLEALKEVYATGVCTRGPPGVLYSQLPGESECEIKLIGFSNAEIEESAAKREVHLERDLQGLEAQLLQCMGVSSFKELSRALREDANLKESWAKEKAEREEEQAQKKARISL